MFPYVLADLELDPVARHASRDTSSVMKPSQHVIDVNVRGDSVTTRLRRELQKTSQLQQNLCLSGRALLSIYLTRPGPVSIRALPRIRQWNL